MEKIENVIKISGIHHAKGGGEQIIIASIKEGGKVSLTLTKVVRLYKETPKQFLNPTPTPKIAHQGPKSRK